MLNHHPPDKVWDSAASSSMAAPHNLGNNGPTSEEPSVSSPSSSSPRVKAAASRAARPKDASTLCASTTIDRPHGVPSVTIAMRVPFCRPTPTPNLDAYMYHHSWSRLCCAFARAQNTAEGQRFGAVHCAQSHRWFVARTLLAQQGIRPRPARVSRPCEAVKKPHSAQTEAVGILACMEVMSTVPFNVRADGRVTLSEKDAPWWILVYVCRISLRGLKPDPYFLKAPYHGV